MCNSPSSTSNSSRDEIATTNKIISLHSVNITEIDIDKAADEFIKQSFTLTKNKKNKISLNEILYLFACFLNIKYNCSLTEEDVQENKIIIDNVKANLILLGYYPTKDIIQCIEFTECYNFISDI